MLEEQKTKLDQQKELKAQAFQSQAEIRKTEQSLWELEKKVAMIGQPPRLDLEGITKRVGAALDEAMKLIRAKKIVDQGGGAVLGPGGSEAVAGGGSSVSSLLEPGLSLDELLQRVTSPDWLRGAGMPRNTETLKVALEARNSLMELERLHQTKMMQMVRILTLVILCFHSFLLFASHSDTLRCHSHDVHWWFSTFSSRNSSKSVPSSRPRKPAMGWRCRPSSCTCTWPIRRRIFSDGCSGMRPTISFFPNSSRTRTASSSNLVCPRVPRQVLLPLPPWRWGLAERQAKAAP